MRQPPKKGLVLTIGFLAHTINNYHNTLLEPYKITTKQAKILAYLVYHQGENILQKDMEQVFFLRSSTVTSVMKNMEKAGYIKRSVNEQDKRMKQIVVTSKGMEVFEHCKKTLEEVEDYVSDVFTECEKENLMLALQRILEKMHPKEK